MYGHSSGAGTYGGGPGGSGMGGAAGQRDREKGVNVSIESYGEWRIQEIGYDGIEKFIRPESFSDHVGKLARKVNWRKIVASDSLYDNPNLLPEDELPDEDEEGETSGSEQKVSDTVPEAGPWHNVAKNLHESLQQVNVFLDNLQVLANLEYVKPLAVFDTQTYSENTPGSSEHAAIGKATQWVWKRKALMEAHNILSQATDQLSRCHETMDSAAYIKQNFFLELKKMRENWRVRKTGDHIYGDLGYRIFGTKYDPRDIFDISQRSAPLKVPPAYRTEENSGSSYLQVTVPCHLMRRSVISVSIVKDDGLTQNLFGSGADSELEYMKIDKKAAENIYWADALKWAQETLICHDTFNQLASDAVRLRHRISTKRDGVLLVGMHDDYLLRIQLNYYPFKATPLAEDGDLYLNRALRHMVLTQRCQRVIRPQMFVDLPLTTLPETLDSRGPNAFTQQDLEERAHRPTFLLDRLINVASHKMLVHKAVDTITKHMTECSDPQMIWRWQRCAPNHSTLAVVLGTRSYDYVTGTGGKVCFFVRIDADSFNVVTKEGHIMECQRDEGLLLHAIRLMICNFLANAMAQIGKAIWTYQILHANMNAMDSDGNPAPTVYMCNPMSTRSILVQFRLGHEPDITVRKITTYGDEEAPFVPLCYKRLPGNSFCKKMDNLFAILRS